MARIDTPLALPVGVLPFFFNWACGCGVLYGLYAVWCCIAVCSYSAVWRCMALYGCMAPGGRRDEVCLLYGATYSEIQRNTAEFHTACHTALSRMPRQRRVAWMCPSRSTCCHGCWVSPNTFSDPVFAHRDAIRMCLSAPFGAIQQEHHTAYHTAVLLHTCDSPRHAFPPAPYSHTAPYSAV